MKYLKYLYQILRCYAIVRRNAPYKRPRYEDRNVLENIIFPYVLAEFKPKKILDIGREDYQEFYNQFFAKSELWTLDYNRKHAEFGSPGRHITDDAVNLGKYFPAESFDLVLCNGVINWGLNDPEKIERTAKCIVKILRPGGLLIIGWNNFPDAKVVKPSDIKALGALKPYRFAPLKTVQFECVNGNHTYNFYIKL